VHQTDLKSSGLNSSNGIQMLKPVLAIALLTLTVSIAFAQAASAPATSAAASAPRKHRLHAPKLRPGATPAVNPETSPDKKGGN
jgi:hypothetical protein